MGPQPQVRYDLRRLARRMRHFRPEDSGFGLIEVIVAMGVVSVTLAALAHTVTIGLTDIGLARQRQGANAIANETVELARGLSTKQIEKGMRTSDVVGDPQIVTNCAGDDAGIYRLFDCSGEQIVHTPNVPPLAPLVPHKTTQTPPGSRTAYDVNTYVSRAGTDATAPLRLTVRVEWEQSFRNGTDAHVEIETILHEPNGCADLEDSSTRRPAPCTSFFNGDASAAKGAVKITGTIDGTTVSSQLDLVSAQANTQLEQIQYVTGGASNSGISLQTGASHVAGSPVGNASVASNADDDPATGADTYDSRTLSGGAAAMLQALVGGITLRTDAAAGNAGGTTSATAAASAQPCPTLSPPGTETDQAACAHDYVQQAAMSAQLALESLGLDLGSPMLASLEGAAERSDVKADREPSVSDDGSILVTGTHSLGSLSIGALPTGILPPCGACWEGHWIRLTPYKATVSASAGASTSPPTATVNSGQVQYWNGLGYSNANLGVAANLNVAPVSLHVNLGNTDVDVEMMGSVKTGAVSTEDPDGQGSAIERRASSATASSPLVVDLVYSLKVYLTGDDDGDEILDVDLNISVDLGALTARATYREAQGA